MTATLIQGTSARPGSGWRRNEEDYGHLHLTKTTFRAISHLQAPAVIDPRAWLEARSPTEMLSCCGDSLATCLEVVHWMKTGGEVVRLSRAFSYLVSQIMDGLIGGNVGATVAGSVKAAKVFGVCREQVMKTRQTYPDGFRVPAVSDAANYRAVSHSLLSSYEQVYQYLAQGLGAVLLATAWRESLAFAGERIDAIEGDTLGGHVFAVVGYLSDVIDDSGRPFLLMVDSHNCEWGENGFALVAPRLFDVWGADRGSLMVGLSDLYCYRPRDLPGATAGSQPTARQEPRPRQLTTLT